MANQQPLPSAACIIGAAQSGKTTWGAQNMDENPNYCIWVDRNRAILRLRPPLQNYVTGSWQQVRKQFFYFLLKFHKVFYNSASDEDIEEMTGAIFAVKNRAIRNFQPIYVYYDECDLTLGALGRQSNVEAVWTKYQGAGLVGIAIVQSFRQMRDLSILFNSNGGVVVFNVTDGDAMGIIQNYGLRMNIGAKHFETTPPQCGVECDLCYVQKNSRVAKAKYIGALFIPTTGQVVRL